MGNNKKKKTTKAEDFKVIVAEFKVSMYCNACERTVAKAISKCKGVEKFTTDMNKHRVVVMGQIDPKAVLKKLKKKTGKKVEMVINKDKDKDKPKDERTTEAPMNSNPCVFDCCKDSDQVLMLFSDENPNACSIM